MTGFHGGTAGFEPGLVPLRPLGEVGEFIRGNGLQKTQLTDRGFPAIHYGEIHSHYGVSTSVTRSFTTSELASKLRRARPGDIVLATTSEDDYSVGKAVAWLGATEVAISGDAYIYRHQLDPLFVAFFFQSAPFRSQKSSFLTGTKVRRISGDALASIRIPVPELPVQVEIARILDRLQRAVAELEAELEEELSARRLQHAHNRQRVLAARTADAPLVQLGDVAEISIGFPFNSAEFSRDESDVALLRGDNIGQGFLKQRDFKRWSRLGEDGLDSYELREGDVVLAMDRPWIPAGLKWARVPREVLPALLVQRVARLRPRSDVMDQQFLGTVISSEAFTQHILAVQTGNTVPHISGRDIGKFAFSLPNIQEQQALACSLDEMDGLATELKAELNAELAARRKQYEYYRDKLLTFEEAPA